MSREFPPPWKELKNARVLLTGGTGLFGRWLLERFLEADRTLALDAQVLVLTRDEKSFRARHPALAAAPQISFLSGDVREFSAPAVPLTHVIHAAADVDPRLEKDAPEKVRDVIVRGTERALEIAAQGGAARFLYVSSGAVYGRQIGAVAEDATPDATSTRPSAYAEGKREAELLCARAAEHGLHTSIARAFAVVGPWLPLDAHFAVGNFIRDALCGGEIRVGGDGTALRSYLYGSDVADWLWTILLAGADGRAYNVGSERAVSIAKLAKLVADVVAPGTPVRIARAAAVGLAADLYIPNTTRARAELGLRETVGLEDAIRRTANWARDAGITR
jgi:nucleoside-diphosphate-sugar epimerase